MSNEYYKYSEYNSFGEYRAFPAEQYASIEKTGKEAEYSRQGHEFVPSQEKSEKKKSPSLLKRLADRISGATRTMVATVASVGAIAVASVAVVLGISSSSPKLELTRLDAGSDYVQYGIELSHLSGDVDYSLLVENPYHTFEIDVDKEGKYEGLTTGLKPGYQYTFSLVGTMENDRQIYYEKEFYTANSDTPVAIFDVQTQFDGEKARVGYSVYLSDAYNRVYSPQAVLMQNGEVYYRDSSINKGFFKGAVEDPVPGTSLLKIVGTIDGKYQVIGEYQIVIPENEPGLGDEKDIISMSELEIRELNTVKFNFAVDKEAAQEKGVTSVLLNIYADGALVDEYEYNLDDMLSLEQYFLSTEGYQKIEAKLFAMGIDENGNPVSVFETEKSMDLEYFVQGEMLVDLYYDTTKLILIGNLPANSVLVVVDKNSGEETEHLISDGYYSSTGTVFEWDFGTGQTTYTYYIKDADGTRLLQGEEFLVDYTVTESEYELSYLNPNEIVVSHNDDGTINLYFDVGFSADDPDVFCYIILGDTVYRFNDSSLTIENIPAYTYGVTYMVCKEINGTSYTFITIIPSGTIEPW